MKRIAFFHTKFPGGGAERVTIDIAKYLCQNRLDYECYVLTPMIIEDLITEEIKQCISIIQIPEVKKEQSKYVEQFVINKGIDLIIQVVQPCKYIRELCKKSGCKAIFANHGEPFWEQYSVIRRRKKSLLFKPMWRLYWKSHFEDKGAARNVVIKRVRKQYDNCDAYTVLCEDYKYEICSALGIDPESSKVVAIENSERLVDDVDYDKEKIIMFCGRLENTSKRLDRLLRIWGKIEHRLPDYRLLIVGDGSYRVAMEQQIIDQKLERVDMVGRHSNVESFYRKASIVCLTSQTEGWGLCLTEGQAHGCIPVAFGCSAGVRSILSPSGVNGFIVTPFDEDEYAQTLVQIAQMCDEERDVIRRNVVAKIANNSQDIIMKKWADLFDSLLNKD